VHGELTRPGASPQRGAAAPARQLEKDLLPSAGCVLRGMRCDDERSLMVGWWVSVAGASVGWADGAVPAGRAGCR
jgi:hypothetical protein